MRCDLGTMSARMRGRILAGDSGLVPAAVSIDSRTVKPAAVFFAIRGEVHDGHVFAADAMARGASAVVVSDASSVAAGTPAILVEDTTRALQDLASAHRQSMEATVIAITGSVGKTTTKDLSRLLLEGDRKVGASSGNLNNHHGLPLALLAIDQDVKAVVLELGISTPGEMDRLLEIARPDLGLVTLIAPVHVGRFARFEDLCEEKMKVARGSRRAVLNADDPEQVSRQSGVPAGINWFGEGELASSGLRLAALRSRGLLGSTLTIAQDGATVELACPLPGAHQARNLLAAAAVARAAGVAWHHIAQQARHARAAPHRGEVVEVGGATLLDDTYNSNPRAMQAALELLAEMPARRRIVVAGDMLELGESSDREHAAVGTLAGSRADVVVGVGTASIRLVETAIAAGADGVHLPDAAAAGEWLCGAVREGDAVLVKGSRGVGLDRAVEHFRAMRGAA